MWKEGKVHNNGNTGMLNIYYLIFSILRKSPKLSRWLELCKLQKWDLFYYIVLLGVNDIWFMINFSIPLVSVISLFLHSHCWPSTTRKEKRQNLITGIASTKWDWMWIELIINIFPQTWGIGFHNTECFLVVFVFHPSTLYLSNLVSQKFTGDSASSQQVICWLSPFSQVLIPF